MYVLRYREPDGDGATLYLKAVRTNRAGELKWSVTTDPEKAQAWSAYRNADDRRVTLPDGEFTVEGIGITEEQATKDRHDTIDTALYNLCRAHDGWTEQPDAWLPHVRTYLDRLNAAVYAEEAADLMKSESRVTGESHAES